MHGSKGELTVPYNQVPECMSSKNVEAWPGKLHLVTVAKTPSGASSFRQLELLGQHIPNTTPEELAMSKGPRMRLTL